PGGFAIGNHARAANGLLRTSGHRKDCGPCLEHPHCRPCHHAVPHPVHPCPSMGPILLVVLLSCLSLVAASVFPSSLSCAASLEVVRRATTGCSVPRSGINLQGRLVVDLETAPALDSAVRPAVLRRAGYGHTVGERSRIIGVEVALGGGG